LAAAMLSWEARDADLGATNVLHLPAVEWTTEGIDELDHCVE
jgi:hypothetical protein